MKKIVIDLDGTLTIDAPGDYLHKAPNQDVVNRLREYHQLGFSICIFTARNMRTFQGDIGKINIFTLPVILEWLNLHEIPYDEVVVGKPWCGSQGFYVDDKAIRPSEFARLSIQEIEGLLANEK